MRFGLKEIHVQLITKIVADKFPEKSEMCVENVLYTVIEILVSATVISIITGRISVCFLFIFIAARRSTL